MVAYQLAVVDIHQEGIGRVKMGNEGRRNTEKDVGVYLLHGTQINISVLCGKHYVNDGRYGNRIILI